MRVLHFRIIALLLLFFVLKIKAQTPEATSKQIFNHLKSKDYEKIDAMFDTTGILKLVTYGQKEQYKRDLNEFGAVKELIRIDEEDNGFKKRIAMAVQFATEKQILYIVFNPKGKIEDMGFDTYTETPFFQLRGYKGFAEVTDLSTTVKTRDGLTLGANIAFGDTSKQKSPLVIFVHGSGPADRDETLGPNKPFRDLAQGLAQQGIASLRYDKRTFAYQYDSKILNDNMTIYEETVYDAIDAVKSAKQFSFVDLSKIYIVGHSQGAMCAPKMAELCPEIKGIVMMAAPVTNLVDVIPQQVEYIAMLNDTISNAEQMQITSVKWMVDKIKSPTLSDKTPKGMLMGASATYWKSVLNYNQAIIAKSLKIPVLIMNGARDYQVTEKEFNAWKKELAGKSNVQYMLYPKLNHLFLEGNRRSEPAEYELPGHIPQYVIDDLSKFIKGK
jgi:dienelactone hydrolase